VVNVQARILIFRQFISTPAAALLSLSILGGCVTFEDYLNVRRGYGLTPVVPLDERPVEEPILANHFVLDSADQSVIGVPQID